MIGFEANADMPQIIFTDNFDTSPSSNWNIVSVASNKNWTYNSTEKCMEINGYSADEVKIGLLLNK